MSAVFVSIVARSSGWFGTRRQDMHTHTQNVLVIGWTIAKHQAWLSSVDMYAPKALSRARKHRSLAVLHIGSTHHLKWIERGREKQNLRGYVGSVPEHVRVDTTNRK